MTPCVLFEAGMQTGEGPIWDDRRACLWCVDSTNPAVWQFDAEGRPLDRIALPQCVGFVCLSDRDDTLLVGLEDGIYTLCPADRRLDLLIDPEPGVTSNRINDAMVDIDGALVFGTLHKDYREPTGAMYRLTPQGQLDRFDTGYIVSNGPCALPDGRLVVANSEIREIYAFDRLPGGGFTQRRAFCDWDPAWGIPDGIIADQAGGVWIGCWDGGALVRLDATGRLTDRVALPASRVTKAALGGPDATRFYITTANRGMDPSREPLAGALFSIDAPVAGFHPKRFALG